VIFRPDRSSGRPVTLLGWRLRIFAAGAVLAGVGVYLAQNWLVWAAIAVLAVGMLVRFLPSGDDEAAPRSDGGDAHSD
jgi:hypothetical protein